jgi:hypothetical protein
MAPSLEAPGGDLRTIPLIPHVQPIPRVLVRGEKGILTTMAICCQPVPGDAIVGYTTRGRGVTVHRADCINAINAQDSARVVPVDWESDATHLYPVAIKIEAFDRQGLMRDIAHWWLRTGQHVSLEVRLHDRPDGRGLGHGGDRFPGPALTSDGEARRRVRRTHRGSRGLVTAGAKEAIDLTRREIAAWAAIVSPERHRWYYRLTPQGEFAKGSKISWVDGTGTAAEESEVTELDAPNRLVMRTRFLYAPAFASQQQHTLTWEVTPRGKGSRVRMSWDAPEMVAGLLASEAGNVLQGLRLEHDPAASRDHAPTGSGRSPSWM